MQNPEGAAAVVRREWEMPDIWIIVERMEDDGVDRFVTPRYHLFLLKRLIEEDTDENAGFVRFVYNGHGIKGKVINASVEPLVVRNNTIMRQSSRLTTVERATMTHSMNKTKYFLIQYNKSFRDFVQAVVREENVSWPTGIKPNQREVVISNEEEQIKAIVLYMSEDEKEIMTEFKKLKIFCFQNTFGRDFFEEPDKVSFLVLYTHGPNKVVYSVTNHLARYHKKDSVGYVTDDDNTYQCIILQRSANRNEVLEYLRDIKITCLLTNFPLNIVGECADSITLPNIQSSYGTAETIQRLYDYERMDELESDLNSLRADVATLIEAMLVLEIRATECEQELYDLGDLHELEALNLLDELSEISEIND